MQNSPHSYSPMFKTIMVCLALEGLLLAILWSFTHSLVESMVLQIIIFGPPSLFFAPWLYKRYKSHPKEPS